MQTPWIKTIEQACEFVLQVGMCGIFHDRSGRMPTLWDVVDYPGKQPGERGWGQKVNVVWSWKNELPARFPDQIFYGKLKGGRAVLLSMPRLRELYSQQYRPVDRLSPLAQTLYEVIEQGPIPTTVLRRALGNEGRAARVQFDRALQELQISFNIVRLNQPGLERDTWVPFLVQYPAFAAPEPAGSLHS